MDTERIADNLRKTLVFGFFLLADVASSATLFFTEGNWQWSDLMYPFARDRFEICYADMVLLCVLRVMLVPLLLTADIYTKRALLLPERKRYQPATSLEYTIKQQSGKNDPGRLSFFGRVRKHFYLIVLFVLIVGCQIYTGIKTIVSRFEHNLVVSAAMLGVLVVCMNVELFLIREISMALARERGKVFPKIHPHPLFLDKSAIGNRCGMEAGECLKEEVYFVKRVIYSLALSLSCSHTHTHTHTLTLSLSFHGHHADLCRTRVRLAYRCRACDFDMCLNCFRKKNLSSAEGLVRNDAGIVEETEVTTWGYVRKALTFLRPYWFMCIMAILFLLGSSLTSLLVPNYQGKILDDVVRDDRPQFVSDVEFFVILNVLIGVLGGVRNLLFNIVGRRMAAAIRERLYSALLHQDIAFFDGMQTGDLTSRITNDVSVLVAPAQTVLTSVLSAAISLVGGFYMCIYTSWRLSVLAFTLIGPITLLYRMYAEWSRLVNKEIWAALGVSNSLATQALSNIRTVRAFAAEQKEFHNFHIATEETVHLSIRDAFVGALTYALTNYLDMAVGVLILWYGGSVAMSQPNVLTVGKLITFQLYW
jgi:hypothetical protein